LCRLPLERERVVPIKKGALVTIFRPQWTLLILCLGLGLVLTAPSVLAQVGLKPHEDRFRSTNLLNTQMRKETSGQKFKRMLDAYAKEQWEIAAALANELLPIIEKEDMPDGTRAYVLSQVAAAFSGVKDYKRAEEVYLSAERFLERSAGSLPTAQTSATHASIYCSLGELRAEQQGALFQAEAYFRSCLVHASSLRESQPHLYWMALEGLGRAYYKQYRFANAQEPLELLLQNMLERLSRNDPRLLEPLEMLSSVYVSGAIKNSERRGREIVDWRLRVAEAVHGKRSSHYISALNDIGQLHSIIMNDHATAVRYYLDAIRVGEEYLGINDRAMLSPLSNLSTFLMVHWNEIGLEQREEASRRIEQLASIIDRGLPKDKILNNAIIANNVGMFFTHQSRNPTKGLKYCRLGLDFLEKAFSYAQANRHAAAQDSAVDQTLDGIFGEMPRHCVIDSAWEVAQRAGSLSAQLAEEAFLAAQGSVRTAAGQAMTKMALRAAGGKAGSGKQRERQDLQTRRYEASKTLESAVMSGRPLSDLRRIVVELDEKLAKVEGELAHTDPLFLVADARPLIGVQAAQASLGADDALVFHFSSGGSEWVWVVTKTSFRWVKSKLNSVTLESDVNALRCGVDASHWSYPQDALGDTEVGSHAKAAQRARADACAKTLGAAPSDENGLPFDLARAHRLYWALFGEVEDLIKGKHLLIVPSSPLTQLPFQALVSRMPAGPPAGAVPRAISRLGVELGPVREPERQRLGLAAGRGVRVGKALPGTPAERAGLKPEDVLLSVAGTALTAVPQGVRTIQLLRPGTPVELLILREGREQLLTVSLEATTITEWVPRLWDAADRDIDWLGARQPLTVLPSVSSLKALRRDSRPALATKPLIGFGNPLLDGQPGKQEHIDAAKLALSLTRCVEPMPTTLAALTQRGSGLAPITMRGGTVEVADLRRQAPLPETAAELCAVARDLKADTVEIRLGARATESEVKRLSANGELAKYRLIHFATHAALAGELKSNAEPGLVMTPPVTASEADDGYLSASEIAGLKLDADWVILSACSTAGPASDKLGAGDADALSGLARAFFYAGARALLVSHWAVNSNATVKLITRANRELAADANVGRAEAMRRSMAAMIRSGVLEEAHPSYWAPFVVVGEGAATLRK
jgi:tetratricopeptide (TPR) repeat protein